MGKTTARGCRRAAGLPALTKGCMLQSEAHFGFVGHGVVARADPRAAVADMVDGTILRQMAEDVLNRAEPYTYKSQLEGFMNCEFMLQAQPKIERRIEFSLDEPPEVVRVIAL